MRTRHAVCGFLRPVPRPCQPHARPCTRHDVLPRAPPRHTPCGSAASPDALPHAPPRRTARAAPPQPPLCGVCVRAREVCVPGRCACEEGWVCWRGLRVLAGLGVCWCAAAGTRPPPLRRRWPRPRPRRPRQRAYADLPQASPMSARTAQICRKPPREHTRMQICRIQAHPCRFAAHPPREHPRAQICRTPSPPVQICRTPPRDDGGGDGDSERYVRGTARTEAVRAFIIGPCRLALARIATKTIATETVATKTIATKMVS